MRVSIDATPLLLRSAGVKNYLYHWLRAMRRVAGAGQIRAFPFLSQIGPLHHDASVLPAWRTLPRLAALYGVNWLGGMALDACLQGADVFHATNQIHHPPRRAKLTATIHDLTVWKMPELHTPANVKADHRFYEEIIRRADGLIAVSNTTRRDAIEQWGIDEDKIETIPSGVSDAFFSVRAEQVMAVRQALCIQKPYLLFVGTIEPRKNLGRLLDAWLMLKADLRREFELLIAGPMGWAPDIARRLDVGVEGVRRLGYVAEEQLPALTAGALVFVFPSLYEGFGFPVVQAMAAGVAVITSNVSALPEITGDAAYLVDPLSTGDIARAIDRLLGSESLREGLGARGKERAQIYRWERCARRSLAFFEKVAGGGFR